MHERQLLTRISTMLLGDMSSPTSWREWHLESTHWGESNRVHIVNVATRRVLVKENAVASKDSAFFKKEYDKLTALDGWGCAPRALAYDADGGEPLMILEYVIYCAAVERHVWCATFILEWVCVLQGLHRQLLVICAHDSRLFNSSVRSLSYTHWQR